MHLEVEIRTRETKAMLTIEKSSEIETRVGNLKLHNFVPPMVEAFIDQSIAAHVEC